MVLIRNNPLGTGRKLTVHKTFRSRPFQSLIYFQLAPCAQGDDTKKKENTLKKNNIVPLEVAMKK